MGSVNGALPPAEDRAVVNGAQEVSALRASVPSACAACDDSGESPQDYREPCLVCGGLSAIELENMRLREALEAIERAPAWGAPDDWQTTPAEVRQLARAALAGTSATQLTRLINVHAKSHMFSGASDCDGNYAKLLFRSRDDREAFLDAHVDAIRAAQAIEARRAETLGSVEDESAVRQDAPNPLSPTPHQGNV